MALAQAPSVSRLYLASAFVMFGCGVADEVTGPPPDGKSDDSHHIQARNCELFIDKIVAYQGSHALRAVNMWVKILPTHLDDSIAQVGFRYRQTGPNANDSSWHDMPLTSWFGASDYYNSASFYVSSDWGRTTWEGAFYARTDNDTNYWFKSPGGGNFVFDINTHDNVMNAMGRSYNYSGTIENAVSTQRDDLTYFNQNHCY